MELVADRFAVLDERRTVDVATGSPVTLVESSAGGPTEQARWAARCDWFFKLRHQSIARLVDFGVHGEMRRFEAWACTEVCDGAAAAVEDVDRSARAFLAACSRTTGRAWSIRLCDGQSVVLPDACSGHELTEGSLRATLPLQAHGLVIVGRRVVSTALEALSEASGVGSRALAIWGNPGAGVRTATLELARGARLHGFVPLRPSAVERWLGTLAPVIRGRSLFLILDEGPERGWSRTLACALGGAKPDVILFVGTAEVSHVDGVALEPIERDALVNAVIPSCVPSDARSQIEDAAARSAGNPGAFVRLLWNQPASADERESVTSRAAESVAAYGTISSEPIESSNSLPADGGRWPLATELTTLRRRLTAARDLVQRGRHEPGCRALRQAIGSMARRHEWEDAVRGRLALAQAFLRRGRAREAQQAIADALPEMVNVGTMSPLWMEVGVVAGAAALDCGNLEDAERLLRATVALAQAAHAQDRLAPAQLALARCLFWRGHYDQADRILVLIERAVGESDVAVVTRAGAARARVAIGYGDAGAAVATGVRALAQAERAGQSDSVARAACALAFAHAAVGDGLAVKRDIGVSVAAARSAHDPLCAVRARLVGAEYAVRQGQGRPVLSFVERLGRIPAAHMPSTVRARRDLLRDLVKSGPGQEIVARHVAASGLPALALFASDLQTHIGKADHTAVSDALEILRSCQIAEDARAVLARVVAQLRAQLHAAGIACLSPEGVVLAADGGRVDPRVAARVLAAQQAITPHLLEGSVEGGAPVRYGGDAIAALVGRWVGGTLHDSSRACMSLALAATAVGPAVAEVMAARRRQSAPGPGELSGMSAAMEDVRRMVDRAAAAPFPVLVEGESGSGKELVARAIHRLGPRRDRPFCGLNCAALPDELVESELFGHARGAFTGAATERPGVFEEAHTGTLFLDEIGELSPRAQAKVLRTIQEGELRRVGENVHRRVDVRIVAATNRNLRDEAAAGRFRRDLLYRLDVVRIALPPLRERREDIALLVERMWQEAASRVGSRATLALATVAALAAYDWPGNVRELQNVLSALAVRSPKRGVVPPTALPAPFHASPALESWRLDDARRLFEERFVRAALVRTAGHRLQASEQLGVTRQGLAKLMTRLGIAD